MQFATGHTHQTALEIEQSQREGRYPGVSIPTLVKQLLRRGNLPHAVAKHNVRHNAEPREAARELARRYLHVFGPGTADGFARWAGISRRAAAAAFEALELVPARTPLGDEWLLAEDEAEVGAVERADGVVDH